MKNVISHFFVCFLLVALVSTGCRKDSLSLNELKVQNSTDFKLLDNHLYFRDTITYQANVLKCLKMSDEEYVEWVKQYSGFYSLRSLNIKIEKEFEAIENIQDENKFYEKYQRYVKVGEDKSLRFINNFVGQSSLMSIDGAVAIGNGVLYSKDGKSKFFENISIESVLSNKSIQASVNVAAYTQEGIIKTSWLSNGGDRKVSVDLISEYMYSNSYGNRIKVLYIHMQQYKKNFWGNWVSNSTTYAGQNVNYTYHYNTYFRVPMDPDYIEKTVSQRSISFGSGGTVSSYNYVLIPEYYAIRQGGFSGSLYSGGLGNYHPFTHDFPW